MGATHRLVVGGIMAAGWGVGLIIPAAQQYLTGESLSALGAAIVMLGVLLLVGGGAAGFVASRRSSRDAVPPPVRATVLATIAFLSFCMLEFSDGLIRQQGRVFYWTSVLFLPALGLLCGLVLARRWAWRVARVAAGLAILWFVGFMVVIPFAKLSADGTPTPWLGRVYMEAVTLGFAGIAAFAFHSLGRVEARQYFGAEAS